MALVKVVAIMKYNKVIIMRDSFFNDIYEKGLKKKPFSKNKELAGTTRLQRN